MDPETPRGASPLSDTLWKPKRRKTYPHFDGHLSDRAIHALVTNPTRVARNAFYPFIVFEKKFNRFGTTTPRDDRQKSRQLRYACRKDSYIYEYYRELLAARYEAELKKRGLSEVVIAYRKLRTPNGHGMCSVDFAHFAFRRIASHDKCIAMVLDISNYFESLDHARIKQIWCTLLNRSTLPQDHYAIFKSLTRYRQMPREEVYRRLGLDDVPRNELPIQLCTASEFRAKLVIPPGAISTNPEKFGIPQGAPVSDLIANFYLLDFDQSVDNYVGEIGGYYRRYCDDILIVYADSSRKWEEVQSFVQTQIAECGTQLQIKQSKTCVHSFDHKRQPPCLSLKGDSKRFEYLGFQFDGARAKFRDRTVSAFYRKLKWALRSEARSIANRFRGKPLSFIVEKFDESKFLEKFGRKKGFSEVHDVREWTFWTYVHRSAEIMGDLSPQMYKQVTNYKRFVRRHAPLALREAHDKANKL
jgi:hypothetical protein